MNVNPFTDGSQVFCNRACIQDVAGRMAEMRRAVLEVHLTLQKANAIIKLCGNAQLLVGGCIASDTEWRIVSGYFGDVAVSSGAKLGVIVARCGVRRLDS